MPRVECRIQLELTPGEELLRLGEGLEQLLADDALGFQLLVRQVIADSLLLAYRTRFDAKASLLTQTEREDQQGQEPTTGSAEEIAEVEASINTLAQRIARLGQLGGRRAASDVAEEEEKLSRAYDRLRKLRGEEHIGQGSEAKGVHSLSTGLYKVNLNLLVDRLLDQSGIVVEAKGGQVVFGIGEPTDPLLSFTPSFTELVKGRPSSARKHNTINFLRQLEWGTGVFAAPERRTGGSVYKLKGGTWRFGDPVTKSGIVLRGTRGAHFLKQASGVPYEADAIRFDFVLHKALTTRLLGLG